MKPKKKIKAVSVIKVRTRGGKKSPNWYLKWTDPITGKERRESTGSKSKRTADTLKERKAEELEDILLGRVDEAQMNAGVNPLSVLPDYLNACEFKGNSKKTISQKKARLQSGLEFSNFGSMETLVKSGKKRLVNFLGQIQKPHVGNIAPSTRDKYSSLFKTFGQWLEAEKFIPVGSNPFGGIPKIGNASNTVNNPCCLSPSDVKKLVEASRHGFDGDRQARRILVICQTGLRHNEARNLKWVDLEGRHIVVRASITKSRKERRIPISTALQEVLDEEHTAQCEELGKEPKPQDAVLKMPSSNHPMLDRLRADGLVAGIVDAEGRTSDGNSLHVHALRHTALTRMAESMPLHHVQKIAGHADIKMTLRYAHIDDDSMLRGIEESSRLYTECSLGDNESDSTSQTPLKLVIGA
jgi:integrase